MGLSDGVSGTNNFFVNTFRWEIIVEKIRVLLQFIPETLSCVCNGNSGWLAYIWRLLTYPLFTDELDFMVSNALNFFISFLQTMVQVLPPFLSYPNFDRSFFHLVSLITETGRLLDKWLVNGFALVLKLFKLASFNLIVEVPEVFFFGTIGRILSFLVVAFEKIIWMVQHLILPFDEQPITNTAYMREVFSFDKPVSFFDSVFFWLFSTLYVVTATLIKLFVLISAMGPQGCSRYPQSCHFYLDGSCAVYCQSRSTIIFKAVPFKCSYTVNTDGRFNYNLDAIEALDSSVFQALDTFDNGFVTLEETRACVMDWDTSYMYRHGDIVAYGDEAYFRKSSRCFYTTLQPQLPSSSCGNQ